MMRVYEYKYAYLSKVIIDKYLRYAHKNVLPCT